MAEIVLVPLQQVIIFIAGLKLIAVLLPDGQAGLLLAPLCTGLDLQTSDQTHRLRAHPVLSAALMLVQVETPGGPQIGNVLLSWGIPLWLGGIRLGGRPPAYRRRVQLLQREVGAVLARRFAGVAVPAPAPEALPEPRTARHARRPALARSKRQQLPRPSRDDIAEELAGIKAAIRRPVQPPDEVSAAVQALQEEMREVKAAIRDIQQEQQNIQAQMQAQTLTFGVFQTQMDVRVAWLEHWRHVAAGAGEDAVPEVEELASLTLVRHLARLLSASIERLLLLEEQVSRLEPKPPPPPSRRGRPRRGRRH
jgi:hypothetical protein